MNVSYLPIANPANTLPQYKAYTPLALAIMSHATTNGTVVALIITFLPNISIRGPAVREPIGVDIVNKLAVIRIIH